MLTVGPTTAVFMDATLKAVSAKTISAGTVQVLDYDLTIPGTKYAGGSLTCFLLSTEPDRFKIGDVAHVTVKFGAPEPVLIPTGKLHVGASSYTARCRVYPDEPAFPTAGLLDCPLCHLALTR